MKKTLIDQFVEQVGEAEAVRLELARQEVEHQCVQAQAALVERMGEEVFELFADQKRVVNLAEVDKLGDLRFEMGAARAMELEIVPCTLWIKWHPNQGVFVANQGIFVDRHGVKDEEALRRYLARCREGFAEWREEFLRKMCQPYVNKLEGNWGCLAKNRKAALAALAWLQEAWPEKAEVAQELYDRWYGKRRMDVQARWDWRREERKKREMVRGYQEALTGWARMQLEVDRYNRRLVEKAQVFLDAVAPLTPLWEVLFTQRIVDEDGEEAWRYKGEYVISDKPDDDGYYKALRNGKICLTKILTAYAIDYVGRFKPSECPINGVMGVHYLYGVGCGIREENLKLIYHYAMNIKDFISGLEFQPNYDRPKRPDVRLDWDWDELEEIKEKVFQLVGVPEVEE